MEELEELKQRLREFAAARDWDQFDVQDVRMSREAGRRERPIHKKIKSGWN